jgi:DNA-binding beta-propeller fold protein YncE
MRERRFLILALCVLLVLLSALGWLYLSISAPVKPVTATAQEDLTFLFQMFGPSADDRFEKPTDVAVDDGGNIYVTDTLNDRVAVFDSSGTFLSEFGTGVIRPLGIDVGPDGTVYVVSKRNDLVVAYDRDGELKRHYKAFIPLDVVAEGDRVYITTIGPIVSYDIATGEDQRLFGWNGREADEFAWPNSITSRDGRLFVADTNNLSLKSVSTTGAVEWVVGKSPTEAKFTEEQGRVFGAPAGVALDEEGRIFVVDAFRDTIYLYDSDGKLVSWGGERGDAEGQFDHPAGIAYGGDGIIYVVDKFNNRVQAFRVTVPGEASLLRGLSAWWCVVPLLLVLLLVLIAYVSRRAMGRRHAEGERAGSENADGDAAGLASDHTLPED